MDKLKLILDILKKYLFWFIFAGTIIVVLVFWWMSTASLAKSFLQEQVKIKKKFDEVKTIDEDKQHPTAEFIKAVNDKNQKLKEGVLKVWETLYNAQKKNNPWPTEVLGDSGVDKVSKMGPNETIPSELREQYQNRIKKYFPILYKIIDLRQPPDTADGGGRREENAAPASRQFMGVRLPMIGQRRPAAVEDNADWVGTVDWDQSDRLRLEDRFNWTARPDSDVIRLRQEDIWVYKTLLQVIRDTNNEGDPQRPIIVPNVKRIEWIQIGADAIGSWSAADQTVFKATTEAAAQAAAPAGARSAPALRDTAAAAQDSKEQLLKYRYVDDKGAPLDAEAKQPYSEFKMMPISMKLYVDQKKISKLLVKCVNSPMPIEVRRVSIHRVASELLESTATAAVSPTGASRDINRRSADVRGPTRSAGAGGGGGEESGAGSYEIPVEIQGIIYIYNPPDLSTLGTGTAAEKPGETTPGADAGAPGETPAAVPAKPGETTPAKP
jgi:hypothetical protein